MQAPHSPRVALLSLVLALGSSAPLRSQTNTLLVGPTVLSFTHQLGAAAAPPSQGVLVTTSGASVTYTASASTTTGGTWLSVGPASGATPATLTVTVNPSGLVAGDYAGVITITASGVPNSSVTVSVSLTVRAASQLAVSPGALQFHFQSGGATPHSQILTVASTGSPLGYTVAASTTSGGSWLLVNPTSGGTPGTVEVSVNVTSLGAATYLGQITISSPGASSGSVTVPVTLTVSSNPRLDVSPEALTFYYQTGGPQPPAQTVSVASSGTLLAFNVTFGTNNGGSWLVPSPLSGATPSTLTVAVNTSGLVAGTYTGTVTVTASGAAGSPRNIAVTLVVTSSPLLTVSPPALTFAYQSGGTAPASQTLAIGSSGAALNYTASAAISGGAWLAIGPLTGSTSGSLTVTVNPSGLSPGAYTGTITLTAAGAGNSPVNVPVRLVVSFSPLLAANPASLSFAYQIGHALPVNQSIAVTSTGSPLSFSVSVSTLQGTGWLSAGASAGTTPANLTISVVPTALTPGTYNGSIVLTSEGAANSPLTIPVTLVVSNSALLLVSPGSLVFDAAVGSSTATVRSVAVTSTDGSALSFTVSSSTSGGGSWLLVGPQAGTTPASLSVSAFATGLSAGVYTGSVVVTAGSAANSPQTIAVTLRVSSSVTIAASPASLTFAQATGGAAPPPAAITLTSSGGPASFTAAASTITGSGWLSVSPSGGTTPASLSVLVNGAALAAGTYNGQITVVSLDAANTPLQIPVTLTVGSSLAASPASLTFNYQIGTPAPPQQALSVTTNSGAALPFTAAASVTAGNNWLIVSPGSATTPASLVVSVNPAGLAAGAYDGVITLTAGGAVNSPLAVSVRLVVTAAPVAPFVQSVVNAASFLPTSVSPGQIITLFGAGIGPASAVGLRLTSSGLVDTNIGDTRVLFDGIAAPMIYASNRQVSAIVPYGVAGRFNTRMELEYQGVRSNVIELRVVDAAPGIFTIDASGAGQGAILNQNFSVNAPSNPAARGSTVMIYATGEGQTNPGGVDGLITGSVLRQPVQPVTVTIGGLEAQVTYAGAAPTLVAGVLQVNAVVPDGVTPSNAVPVVVTVGGARSQAGVTMAVR